MVVCVSWTQVYENKVNYKVIFGSFLSKDSHTTILWAARIQASVCFTIVICLSQLTVQLCNTKSTPQITRQTLTKACVNLSFPRVSTRKLVLHKFCHMFHISLSRSNLEEQNVIICVCKQYFISPATGFNEWHLK